MEIKIGFAGEDNQELLQSMHEWLIDDYDIRTASRIKLVDSHPKPGSMAGEIELISLLVSSGFNMASLAVAIASWRSMLSTPPPVQIEAKSIQLTISGTDSEPMAIEKIKEALAAAQGQDERGDS